MPAYASTSGDSCDRSPRPGSGSPRVWVTRRLPLTRPDIDNGGPLNRHVSPAQVLASSHTKDPGLTGRGLRYGGLPPVAEATRSGLTDAGHDLSHAVVSRPDSRRPHVADVRTGGRAEE